MSPDDDVIDPDRVALPYDADAQVEDSDEEH